MPRPLAAIIRLVLLAAALASLVLPRHPAGGHGAEPPAPPAAVDRAG